MPLSILIKGFVPKSPGCNIHLWSLVKVTTSVSLKRVFLKYALELVKQFSKACPSSVNHQPGTQYLCTSVAKCGSRRRFLSIEVHMVDPSQFFLVVHSAQQFQCDKYLNPFDFQSVLFQLFDLTLYGFIQSKAHFDSPFR